MTEIWGGVNAATDPVWWHYYGYDRYGNRTWASRQGPSASSIPLDAAANVDANNQVLSYQDASQQNKTLTNRITTAGYTYDDAGNLTRGQSAGGTWQRYKYDAAGRLAVVQDDSGNALESYSYGASNQWLLTGLWQWRGHAREVLCVGRRAGDSRVRGGGGERVELEPELRLSE